MTNNSYYIERLVFILEKLVPAFCLSGFAFESVKKKSIINLKSPNNKIFFWPLLFGILKLMSDLSLKQREKFEPR